MKMMQIGHFMDEVGSRAKSKEKNTRKSRKLNHIKNIFSEVILP